MNNKRPRNQSLSKSSSSSSTKSSSSSSSNSGTKKEMNIVKFLQQRETGNSRRRPLKIRKFMKNNFTFKDKTLYVVEWSYILDKILEYNPSIELHKINIIVKKDKSLKVNYNIFKKLEVENDIYAQVVLTDNEGHEVFHTFNLFGKDEDGDDVPLLNDLLLLNTYTNADFTTLYFIHVFNSHIDNENVDKTEIYDQFIKNHNLNLIDDLDITKEMINKALEEKEESSTNKIDNISKGGLNKQKYIKLLKGKSFEKLKKIAKNKNISYLKKVNGVYASIKKDTLIKKLCKYKYKSS
mgnify:CR=1 FL=1